MNWVRIRANQTEKYHLISFLSHLLNLKELQAQSLALIRIDQGSKSQTVLKFRSLSGMILFWYCDDASMHDVDNGLELKEGDEI